MGKSNQKTVKVIKEPCNKTNLYTAINLRALSLAGNKLSGDAFKMWVYFSKNQNAYEFELSSKHAEETFSLTKRRYDNAIRELIEEGFLVDTNTDPKDVKNSWTFYEIPLGQIENKPLQKNDTSLVDQNYKPCAPADTRNNTENTNNRETIVSQFSAKEGKPFSEMTNEEKRRMFDKNY